MGFNKIKKKSKKTISEDSSGNTIFHQVEDFLREKYEIRRNVISLDIEICHKGKNEWKTCNENNIFIEMQKSNIKVSMNNFISILKSDFVPDFNPLVDYFGNLQNWNGQTDYIRKYAEYVELAPGEDIEQYLYHFKKWCVRAVKCATINGYFNKQAFILTDDGKGQNIGKSTWCRNMCPKELSNYIAEDMGGSDKDSRLLLCKNLIINLDELAALGRQEINQLKSQLSKDQINERLPYDRKNSVLQRVASFIGSTNKSTFLLDETGSVRWLCFTVSRIDFSYTQNFNIDNLWAQAYALSLDKNYDETISRIDIEKNEIRNKKFQVITQEHEMILRYFRKPKEIEEPELLTSTEILNYLQNNFTRTILKSINIGKALSQENYNSKKTGGKKCYLVIKKEGEELINK